MKHLNTHVHVFDDAGERHVFGPGDDVPAWAAKKITNPHVWAGGDGQTDTADSDADTSGGGEVAVPPMTGTGSGKEAWARYAAARGVSVPDGARRDDIVQALRDAGVPVEPDEE